MVEEERGIYTTRSLEEDTLDKTHDEKKQAWAISRFQTMSNLEYLHIGFLDRPHIYGFCTY